MLLLKKVVNSASTHLSGRIPIWILPDQRERVNRELHALLGNRLADKDHQLVMNEFRV